MKTKPCCSTGKVFKTALRMNLGLLVGVALTLAASAAQAGATWRSLKVEPLLADQ